MPRMLPATLARSVVGVLGVGRVHAQGPGTMPTPIDGLADDIVDAFTGPNLLYYGGAVAGSAAMAFGGVDHDLRAAVQRGISAPAYADGAYYAGYLVPALVAPPLYLTGVALHDRETAGAGSAAVQALGVTLVTTGVLKVGVGRVYPLNGGDPNAPDRLAHPEYAHTFRPFQVLWPLPSWPSGHTSATTCIAAALTAYYPEQPWIPLTLYPLALAIGFGMVVGDNHWVSDVVAGALIGHAIGYSIGKSFRKRVRGDNEQVVRVVPMVGPSFGGVGVGARW